jgi:hypothetical protein
VNQRTNILKASYEFLIFTIFFDHKKDLDGVSGSVSDDLPGGAPGYQFMSVA